MLQKEAERYKKGLEEVSESVGLSVKLFVNSSIVAVVLDRGQAFA